MLQKLSTFNWRCFKLLNHLEHISKFDILVNGIAKLILDSLNLKWKFRGKSFQQKLPMINVNRLKTTRPGPALWIVPFEVGGRNCPIWGGRWCWWWSGSSNMRGGLVPRFPNNVVSPLNTTSSSINITATGQLQLQEAKCEQAFLQLLSVRWSRNHSGLTAEITIAIQHFGKSGTELIMMGSQLF